MNFRYILIWLMILSCQLTIAQKPFCLSSKVGPVKIELNGESILIDSNRVEVHTRYPEFDTLRLPYTGGDPIYCNFKPDSCYLINYACCATYDIVPESRYRSFPDFSLDTLDEFQEMEMVKGRLMDFPDITFKLESAMPDTVYAWYADHACFPTVVEVSEKEWHYGSPQKCFYWSNISHFEFFTTTVKDMYINDYGDLEEYRDLENSKLLGSIATRLFDDESFLISYDPILKKVSLQYLR